MTHLPVLANPHARMLLRSSSVTTTACMLAYELEA
jgi:hypothetical protein